VDTDLPDVAVIGTSNFLVNQGTNVILSGIIKTSKKLVFATWTCSDVKNFSISNVPLSPLTSTLGNVGSTALFKISINSFALSLGGTYTFKLSSNFGASLASNPAVATVIVQVNAPPYGGTFAVSPSQGNVLQTMYFLSSSFWLDDNYPLTYSYSYYVIDSSSAKVIKFEDQVPYVSAYLGQGLKSSNYLVNCVANIYDTLHSAANKTVQVAVYPSLQSSQLFFTNAISYLNISVLNQDYSTTSQIIIASTSSINFVSCTVAVSCSLLNRYECSSISNTCGS
jgi:hypothetical protein